MNRTKWAAIAIAVLFAGCSGASSGVREQVIDHSPGVRPLWIQQCPVPDKESFPFCGEARGKQDSESACSAAYADALGKLRRFIGQKVGARVESDGSGGWRFKVQGTSEPIELRGVWEDQRWYETTRSGTSCWVMLVYPRLEYENLVNLARRAFVERMKKADAALKEAGELQKAGCPLKSFYRLELAEKLLEGISEQVAIEGIGDPSALRVQARQRLDSLRVEVARMNKTVLVAVRYAAEDGRLAATRAERLLRDGVSQLVSAAGLEVKSGSLGDADMTAILSGNARAISEKIPCLGAGWLLVLSLEGRYLGNEDGIHFVSSEGSLRLYRASDGREVGVLELREKQGHPFSASGAVERSARMLIEKKIKPELGMLLAKAGGNA
ncbi:MAG: hypothetical protein D6806_05875 [Deltaproteobacteria bacterium]|nr:MAG: hypothetical protein D6806_05875 [Deltaproteobacteria bacterium]